MLLPLVSKIKIDVNFNYDVFIIVVSPSSSSSSSAPVACHFILLSESHPRPQSFSQFKGLIHGTSDGAARHLKDLILELNSLGISTLEVA